MATRNYCGVENTGPVLGSGSGSTGACGNTFGETVDAPGGSARGGTTTGATGTGGPLPAERLANSARLTTVSAGTVPIGTIAKEPETAAER